MKTILIPKSSSDKASISSINKINSIAKELLLEWNIELPRGLEFYDSINEFIKRIVPQVQEYGLTKKEAVEFIKASLNYSSYGTFDIPKNKILEMNFNPYFKFFYPANQFLMLIIHESIHLFLYSKLNKDIYKHKFKFQGDRYIGKEKIIQLDEGFATFLTKEITRKFNFKTINTLPIYSKVTSPPKFKTKVGKLNIKRFSEEFNNLYEKNKKEGIKIIKAKYNNFKNMSPAERVQELINFVQKEVDQIID